MKSSKQIRALGERTEAHPLQAGRLGERPFLGGVLTSRCVQIL